VTTAIDQEQALFKFTELAKRYTRPLTVTAAVSASALVLAASPALAASQPQASVPRYYCQLFVSEPKVSPDGHEITGSGGSTCTGTGWQDQKVVVLVEAHDFPTLYEVLAQASTDYSSSRSLRETVSWPCTFSGTRTYTIETAWYGDDGNLYASKFPAQSLSLTCSS
jgi:hypothetical protein